MSHLVTAMSRSDHCIHGYSTQIKTRHLPLSSIYVQTNAPVHTVPLQYGRQQKTVLPQLAKYIPAHHEGAQLEQTGLWVRKDKPWQASSTDGIFICTCHGTCSVEVKCPLTFRRTTVWDVTRYQVMLEQDPQARPPPPHTDPAANVHTWCPIWSVCSEGEGRIEWFSCALRQRTSHPSDTHPADLLEPTSHSSAPDPTAWEPSGTHTHPTPTPHQQLCCYCQQPYDESDNDRGAVLVGCDEAACPFKWIHLHYIQPKHKAILKGNWYCPRHVKSRAVCFHLSYCLGCM